MNKRSQGSWICDGNGFEPTFNISNSERSIATVTTSRQDGDLIAAAPELLEALETYVRLFDEFKLANDPDDKRRLIDGNLHHHDIVRKLIKNARGES